MTCIYPVFTQLSCTWNVFSHIRGHREGKSQRLECQRTLNLLPSLQQLLWGAWPGGSLQLTEDTSTYTSAVHFGQSRRVSQFLREETKNVFSVKVGTSFRTWKLQAEARRPNSQDIHFKHGSINKRPVIRRGARTFTILTHKSFSFYAVNNEFAGLGLTFHSINIRNLRERFWREFKILLLRGKNGVGGALYLPFQLSSLATNSQLLPLSHHCNDMAGSTTDLKVQISVSRWRNRKKWMHLSACDWSKKGDIRSWAIVWFPLSIQLQGLIKPRNSSNGRLHLSHSKEIAISKKVLLQILFFFGIPSLWRVPKLLLFTRCSLKAGELWCRKPGCI